MNNRDNKVENIEIDGKVDEFLVEIGSIIQEVSVKKVYESLMNSPDVFIEYIV